MNAEQIMEIFKDTAYTRTGGSPEELRCAQYLQEYCKKLGLEAKLEAFEVPMAKIQEVQFLADGVSIPCKGYLCAGSGQVEAPFYYLPNTDPCSLSGCKGKIVMVDSGMGYWIYQDLLENGALGFVTYDGNANYADRDMDQRELRSYVSKGNKIPSVNINAKDAISLIEKDVKTAKIILKQEEFQGQSHNVVLDLPGEIPEIIVLTAHYDSTSLSQGAYDNMSGCVGLLSMAEHFSKNPHRYGLRFIWCGSEERGLLGPPPLQPALCVVWLRGTGAAGLQGLCGRPRGGAEKSGAECQSGHDRLHHGQVHRLLHHRGKAGPLHYLYGKRAGLRH